jgi:hypothetical protein
MPLDRTERRMIQGEGKTVEWKRSLSDWKEIVVSAVATA